MSATTGRSIRVFSLGYKTVLLNLRTVCYVTHGNKFNGSKSNTLYVYTNNAAYDFPHLSLTFDSSEQAEKAFLELQRDMEEISRQTLA